MGNRIENRLCLAIVVVMLAAACGGGPQPEATVDTAEVQPAPEPMPDVVVDTAWLAEHLDDPDLVVLDCSVRVEFDEDGTYELLSGRAGYDEGHIPTAGFADLLGELSDQTSDLKFALPTPERFSEVMGGLGVGDDSRVVLYDAEGSGWAARVWWMLRWIGFDRAAVLDGGLAAWTGEDRPLSTEPAGRAALTLTPAPRPELIADRDDVLAAVNDGGVCIVDALPEAHFRGEMAMYGRPGHIAGAVNVPSSSFVDESGRFLPLDELAALQACEASTPAITYCGGGIAASMNALVMTRLGRTDVALYAASLQEWAADPANPMETGAP